MLNVGHDVDLVLTIHRALCTVLLMAFWISSPNLFKNTNVRVMLGSRRALRRH
jgi:hypothetical protein